MQNTLSPQIHAGSQSRFVGAGIDGTFTVRVSIVASIVFAVFAVTLISMDPGIARYPVIWAFWLMIAIVGVGTYRAGRSLQRRVTSDR